MPVIQMTFDVSGVRRGTSDAVRAMGQLTRAVDKLAAEYANAGRAAAASGHTMSSSFGGAASSIRRVAVELAGLYSAMKVLDKMKGFIERGIEYNATLETSQLTIASIIGAVNDISDAQGRVLQGAEKFQAAEELSKGLLEEMRVLAMEVPASFADIAKGVASIIAPATKAGIALERLPKFTVSAVQAMSAMGLHTMQMRTEIEAILSGNINKVQDVLATNLGITGEMVRNWQKQGILLDELEKKFTMFNLAGIRALTTWGGLQANMQGALDELAGFASKDLFEKIKNAWADLIEFMLERGDDGKLHLGKNIEGLMKLLREIEGEIGNVIVDAVKKLIKWISDLNKPENLAVALQTWRKFKQSCMDVINKVIEVANSINTVTNACISLAGEVKGVVDAFKGIDDWLEKHPTATSLLTGGASKKASDAVTMLKAGRAVAKHGEGALPAFLRKILPEDDDDGGDPMKVAEAELLAEARAKVQLAPSHGPKHEGMRLAPSHGKDNPNPQKPEEKKEATKDEPATKKYQLTPTIPRYAPKAKKPKAPKKSAEQRDAERFAESSSRYAAGLQELRNEVEALERSMQPGLTTYDRMIAKINAEKDAAVKNADVKAQESIRRKECTAAQAEETAALEKRKAELEAAHQIEQLELQTLQDRANWYRDYAALSGQTGQDIALQNQLIDRQAQEWAALGIPMDDISRRVQLMKEQIATDPLSGLKRGFRTLTTQAQNDAQIMESALVQTCDMMGQAFGAFVSGGKVSMNDLLNSWLSMINQMIAKAAMSKIFSLIGNWAFGTPSPGAGGGVSAAASAISAGVGLLAAHGYAFSGLSGYRNQIVTSPTVFGYGRRLTAYAHGGVMGEAGPEAVVPLARTRGGDLGIQAAGAGMSSMEMTLVIEDKTSGGVNAQAAGGMLDGRQLQVVVRQVEQAMVGRAMQGTSPYTRYIDQSRGLSPAKQLY